MTPKKENLSARWCNSTEDGSSDPKLGAAEPQPVDIIYKMKYSDTKTTICKLYG